VPNPKTLANQRIAGVFNFISISKSLIIYGLKLLERQVTLGAK
jgi:hypothetical protein